MASDSPSQRKAHLDEAEREHLEAVVTWMRERVEDDVEFQLAQHGLDDEPGDVDSLAGATPVHEEFSLGDGGILEASHDACDELADAELVPKTVDDHVL